VRLRADNPGTRVIPTGTTSRTTSLALRAGARGPLRVVKVGGSLYDLPDFGTRLQGWLQRLDNTPKLLIPGGGKPVRSVRRSQLKFGFDDETAHWLSIRTLQRNAKDLAKIVRATVGCVEILQSPTATWPTTSIAILDCYSFLLQDEGIPDCLPHSWSVTSDSIAARAASLASASELILLKSIDFPKELTWENASKIGYVDPHFPILVRRNPALPIRFVNLRNIAQTDVRSVSDGPQPFSSDCPSS